MKEFSEKMYLKWPNKADKLLEVVHKMPFYFCESTEKLQGKLRDKKDIPVLSDALYNNIDILLTGDKDFLESEIKRPIIFSPKMLMEYLLKK